MDYKPNSHKYKAEQKALEEKKVEKVVKGNVKVKKKSELRKFTDEYLFNDLTNLKTYILRDVIIPEAKKIVSDIVNTILYGETRSHKGGSGTSKISYGGFFNQTDDRRVADVRTRSIYNYDDIIFSNRGDAEEVLYRMDELIANYGLARIADFCEFAGVSIPYTGNRYGWTDIHNAAVVRVRDGYMIRLPKAIPID